MRRIAFTRRLTAASQRPKLSTIFEDWDEPLLNDAQACVSDLSQEQLSVGGHAVEIADRDVCVHILNDWPLIQWAEEAHALERTSNVKDSADERPGCIEALHDCARINWDEEDDTVFVLLEHSRPSSYLSSTSKDETSTTAAKVVDFIGDWQSSGTLWEDEVDPAQVSSASRKPRQNKHNETISIGEVVQTRMATTWNAIKTGSVSANEDENETDEDEVDEDEADELAEDEALSQQGSNGLNPDVPSSNIASLPTALSGQTSSAPPGEADDTEKEEDDIEAMIDSSSTFAQPTSSDAHLTGSVNPAPAPAGLAETRRNAYMAVSHRRRSSEALDSDVETNVGTPNKRRRLSI